MVTLGMIFLASLNVQPYQSLTACSFYMRVLWTRAVSHALSCLILIESLTQDLPVQK